MTFEKPFKQLNTFRGHVAMAVTAVVAVGSIHLMMPFHGDQALFTLAGLDLAEGYTLYRDFWDIKQPGIFLFFWLAGSIFGFTEVGIHAFEMLYWIVFCITSCVLLRSYLPTAMAVWAPAATVIAYYLASGVWHMTQLEMIVAFPLLMCVTFAVKSLGPSGLRRGDLLIGGIAGGIILVFKITLLPILMGIWLVLLGRAIRYRLPLSEISVGVLTVTIGTLVPLGATLAIGYAQGVGDLMWTTFFVVPPRVLAETPGAPFSRLLSGIRWFLTSFGVLAGLAFLGVLRIRDERYGPFIATVLAWGIGAGVAIVMQRTSWWTYHLLLLLPPTVLLAAFGVSVISLKETIGVPPAVRFALIALAALVAAWPLSVAAASAASGTAKVVLSGTDRSYGTFQSDSYDRVVASGGALSLTENADTRKPAIVFGDPLHLYLNGLRQAIPTNGWALEFLTAEGWERLSSEVMSAGVNHIYLAEYYQELLRSRAPNVMSLLETEFEVMHSDNHGRWFVAGGAGPE